MERKASQTLLQRVSKCIQTVAPERYMKKLQERALLGLRAEKNLVNLATESGALSIHNLARAVDLNRFVLD